MGMPRRILLVYLVLATLVVGQQRCVAQQQQEEAHAEHKDKFIGTYILVMNDLRRRTQRNAVCEIQENRILVDEQEWGTWQATNGSSLTLTPSSPSNGEVKLSRRSPAALAGQEAAKDGAVKWQLERVYVVSKWQHQAGNQPPMELKLWSNGRAIKPDGRVKWKLSPATNELVLQWPETNDRCKLSSDGNRYEGRNEHGTLITGKKIQ